MAETRKTEKGCCSLPNADANWVYWERTNPAGLKIFIAVIATAIFGVSFFTGNWFLLFVLIALVPGIGGFELYITPKRFAVRLGYLRIPIYVISLKEIASVDILESALPRIGIGYSRHHAGWGTGWRFVVGRRFLEVKADRNRRVLISSANCEEVKKLIDGARH